MVPDRPLTRENLTRGYPRYWLLTFEVFFLESRINMANISEKYGKEKAGRDSSD